MRSCIVYALLNNQKIIHHKNQMTLILINKNYNPTTPLCSSVALAASPLRSSHYAYSTDSNTDLEGLINLSKIVCKVKPNRSVLKRNVFVNLSYSSLIVEECTGAGVKQICASMKKYFEELPSIDENFYQLDLNVYLLRDGLTKVCTLESTDLATFEKTLVEYNVMLKNLSTIFGLTTKDTSAHDIISNNIYPSLKGHSFRLNKKLNELTSCFIKIQQNLSARIPEDLSAIELETINNFPKVYFSKMGKDITTFTKLISSTANKTLKISDKDIFVNTTYDQLKQHLENITKKIK